MSVKTVSWLVAMVIGSAGPAGILGQGRGVPGSIVFYSARDRNNEIYLMDPAGGGQTNLTPKNPVDLDGDWISRAPSWSKNGRQIYFMSSRPSTGLDTEIFVMNWDGSEATRLTNSIGVDGSPRSR